MTDNVETIGIVAGGGIFPRLVARGARSRGLRVAAVGFPGHTDEGFSSEVDDFRELKLGQLGKLIDYFRGQGVSRVVMAGTINKPKALDIRPDIRAAKLIFSLRGRGDDALIRAVASELESETFHVLPPHELVPELLAPEGVLTRREPTIKEWADLAFGWNAAKELGRLDVGQCVVVRKGVVAAVEALEGTDRTIERGCEFGGPGCSCIKVFKPGQTDRADLPSAGANTISILAEGKGVCLGVEAGRSLLFDREATVALADEKDICIVGLSRDLLDRNSS